MAAAELDEFRFPVVPTEAERSEVSWRDLLSTIGHKLSRRGPSTSLPFGFAQGRRSALDDGWLD